jgi:hypothetical protein
MVSPTHEQTADELNNKASRDWMLTSLRTGFSAHRYLGPVDSPSESAAKAVRPIPNLRP